VKRVGISVKGSRDSFIRVELELEDGPQVRGGADRWMGSYIMII
jgi:hypothetical protein